MELSRAIWWIHTTHKGLTHHGRYWYSVKFGVVMTTFILLCSYGVLALSVVSCTVASSVKMLANLRYILGNQGHHASSKRNVIPCCYVSVTGGGIRSSVGEILSGEFCPGEIISGVFCRGSYAHYPSSVISVAERHNIPYVLKLTTVITVMTAWLEWCD